MEKQWTHKGNLPHWPKTYYSKERKEEIFYPLELSKRSFIQRRKNYFFQATTEETEPNSQEDENDGGKTQKGNTELAPSGLFANKLVLR